MVEWKPVLGLQSDFNNSKADSWNNRLFVQWGIFQVPSNGVGNAYFPISFITNNYVAICQTTGSAANFPTGYVHTLVTDSQTWAGALTFAGYVDGQYHGGAYYEYIAIGF